jgi:hypothetical protein
LNPKRFERLNESKRKDYSEYSNYKKSKLIEKVNNSKGLQSMMC